MRSEAERRRVHRVRASHTIEQIALAGDRGDACFRSCFRGPWPLRSPATRCSRDFGRSIPWPSATSGSAATDGGRHARRRRGRHGHARRRSRSCPRCGHSRQSPSATHLSHAARRAPDASRRSRAGRRARRGSARRPFRGHRPACHRGAPVAGNLHRRLRALRRRAGGDGADRRGRAPAAGRRRRGCFPCRGKLRAGPARISALHAPARLGRSADSRSLAFRRPQAHRGLAARRIRTPHARAPAGSMGAKEETRSSENRMATVRSIGLPQEDRWP